jgi:chromosome partitioning protein
MAGSAWYDLIALATSKGSVGKSTLARGLAAHWFALGRKPALVDPDPTATLSKRYNPQGKLGAVPVIAEPEEMVAELIGKLRVLHRPVITPPASATAPPSAPWPRPISPLFRSSRQPRISTAPLPPMTTSARSTTPKRQGHPIHTAMIFTMTMHGTVIARHVRSQLKAAGYPLLHVDSLCG